MKKIIVLFILIVLLSCGKDVDKSSFIYNFIDASVNSSPINKYKTHFLKLYEPFSPIMRDLGQRKYGLNGQRVDVVSNNSFVDYYFKAIFLNDSCIALEINFYHYGDNELSDNLIGLISQQYGKGDNSGTGTLVNGKESSVRWTLYWQKDKLSTTLSFSKNDSILSFSQTDSFRYSIADTIINWDIPAYNSKPQPQANINIVLPDSLKNEIKELPMKYLFYFTVNKDGDISDIEMIRGDKVAFSYIKKVLSGVKMKPAVNKFGKAVSSKMYYHLEVK